MKKKLCPQCKVGRFRVFNQSGESIVVEVNESFEIVPLHPDQLLDGFDLETLFCLGCSWKGAASKLVKH